MNDYGPFSEQQLSYYSHKIFGFALSKTTHEHNAQDLSQEILLSLYRSLLNGKKIDNMEAWVNTICRYTWSNYLAKEKRHWHYSELEPLSHLCHQDRELLKDIELDKMREEIAYLSRLHREITVRYYYEQQSVEQIAIHLKLAEGTIKWHLFEVRKKLKEALKVEKTVDQLSFNPIHLRVGHSGTPGPNHEPNSYFQSLLTANVCIAIYEKALSIEEIARKLGTASAFVEDEFQKLMKSDLVIESSKGKYRTNFMIETISKIAAESCYFKSKAEELAEEIYSCVSLSLDEIRATGFHGAQLSEHALLWTLLPYAIWEQYLRAIEPAYYEQNSPDERKDGGKYIVDASIVYSDEEYRRDLPDYEIIRKYATNGIKTRGNNLIGGVQMESWWSGMTWRNFDTSDLIDLAQAVELIESDACHNDFDKLVISRLIEKGFVSLNHGKLECMVPFFTFKQHDRLKSILEMRFEESGMTRKLEQIHDDMKALNTKIAPSFMPMKEIIYKSINDGMTIVFAVLEYLTRTGKLALPDEEEKKRLTTLIWRKS
ncbi:RNA polymerase sigma factor [Paenibacillus sp. MMO-58]|uniref:RNA polymerase sigma factor n=1 Tax=Paenibacillus sp. MMO-58 TaxID=3081290 RepID=UPI00301AC7FB